VKAQIGWIFFQDLKELIKNDSNNENWLTVAEYVNVLSSWSNKIAGQQQESEQIQAKNKKTQELAVAVYSWFVNEYNRLKQEKTKQCPQCGNIQVVPPLKKEPIKCQQCGQVNWRYPRTKEKPYQLEDLVPYLSLRQVYSQKYEQFSNFLTSLKDQEGNIITNEKTDELSKKLTEWKDHNEGKDVDSNPYEIWVEERTKNNLKFLWKPVEQELEITNEEGKTDKKKAIIIPLLTSYLFNYYGEWFEVEDWKQTNYQTVTIFATRSIFYNDFWALIKTDANGIIHHSPIVGGKEICSCPNFGIPTTSIDLGNVYELKLGLYKLNKDLIKHGNYVEDEGLPLVVPFAIHKVDDPGNEVTGAEGNDSFSKMWDAVWKTALGTVYFLLSERMEEDPRSTFLGSQVIWKTYENVSGKSIPAGESLEKLFKSLGIDLSDPKFYHFLRYHIKATLYWRKKQIWQGNYWQIHTDFRVGESVNPAGTCITIYGNNTVLTRITENITVKVGGNAFVNKFIECAIDTTLNDDKGQNNRQSERSVISESSTNGGEVKRKKTNTKTTSKTKDLSEKDKGIEGGNSFLQPSLYNIDHTKSEYTTLQFQHRYFLGGRYPLSLKLDFNDNVLSQYVNRTELKGKMRYDYYNTNSFGSLLNNEGFFKSSIISWNFNASSDSDEWFREKIESGIYLATKDQRSFYRKKLTDAQEIQSIGGVPDEPFNIVTISERRSVGSGWDNIAHMGEPKGLYVYKDSRLWVGKTNSDTDLFPWLMNQLSEHWRDGGYFWSFIHPESWTKKFKIPSQYLDNNNPKYKGETTCKIFYRFHFFSSDKQSDEGDEMFATEFIVRRASESTKGIIHIEVLGNLKYKTSFGNPDGQPPGINPPKAPVNPTEQVPNPFDTNITKQGNNLLPGPSGGEPEFNVPDIDTGMDIDIPGPDVDLGTDYDPGTDPDLGPDVDLPDDDND